MMDVNITKINVSQFRGLNIRNRRKVIEQMVIPNDCAIVKLIRKRSLGFARLIISAVATHRSIA